MPLDVTKYTLDELEELSSACNQAVIKVKFIEKNALELVGADINTIYFKNALEMLLYTQSSNNRGSSENNSSKLVISSPLTEDKNKWGYQQLVPDNTVTKDNKEKLEKAFDSLFPTKMQKFKNYVRYGFIAALFSVLTAASCFGAPKFIFWVLGEAGLHFDPTILGIATLSVLLQYSLAVVGALVGGYLYYKWAKSYTDEEVKNSNKTIKDFVKRCNSNLEKLASLIKDSKKDKKKAIKHKQQEIKDKEQEIIETARRDVLQENSEEYKLLISLEKKIENLIPSDLFISADKKHLNKDLKALKQEREELLKQYEELSPKEKENPEEITIAKEQLEENHKSEPENIDNIISSQRTMISSSSASIRTPQRSTIKIFKPNNVSEQAIEEFQNELKKKLGKNKKNFKMN